MIKLLAILSIVVCVCSKNYAQKIPLSGSVKDSSEKISLKNAVIYLKNQDNSRLVAFTRAGENGNFEFKHTLPGNYLMVVTYPGYVDWIDSVQIGGKTTGNIPVFLITKVHLLEEVIVKNIVSPIRIKGDTTEFLADSFHVRPGATVEELLKVLPGLSVNAKGEIKAYGQSVQNVLVDGEEFFGNDPTMATQNLNKSDIAKVQLYDKKSDKSVITGIDDGVKQKTINLILKDDAKKGYFGELLGGTDFNNFYQAKATISRFTSTVKMGALFVVDRTGRDVDVGDFGTFDVRRDGIPESIQASGMYNKKFGSAGNTTANNITYNHLDIIGSSSTEIKYILPDTVYYSNQYRNNKSSSWQEVLNSKNLFKLDSATTLTVNAKALRGQTTSNITSNGNFLAGDNTTVINASKQNNNSTSNNNTENADLFLKRVFNKAGTKFFTLGASFASNHTNGENILSNTTTYYAAGTPSSQQVLDQKKMTISSMHKEEFVASYVNPFSKNLSLNLNYTFTTTNTDQDIRTYENRNGKYDSLNMLYSNHYKFNNIYHQVGSSLNFASKKLSGRAGLSVQSIRLKQIDVYTDSLRTRTFINFFPTAGLSWKYSKTGTMNFNYYGRTQQPTLTQLQPIRNNDDPLNIQIGNPDLKPSFSHTLAFDLSNIKEVTGRLIRFNASVTVLQNNFSSISNIDNQGRRVFQTVNVDGDYSFNTWVSFYRTVKFFGDNLDVTIQPDFTQRHYTNFINAARNSTDVSSFSPMLYITRRFSPKFPFNLQFTYSYQLNHSVSSVSTGLPTNYSIHDIGLYLTYIPKNGWRFYSNNFYSIRQKLSPADINTNSLIWTVSIEKLLSKKANLYGIFKVNDILKQNLGFTRTISSTSITENRYATVPRFALFSLQWRFNKNRNPAN